MTFEEWLEDTELEAVTNNSYTCEDLKAAWNAAISEAQMIAWKHARGITLPSGTCNPCDNVAEQIRQLEAE